MKKVVLTTLLLSAFAFSGNAQQILDSMDPTASGALFRNNVLNKNDNSKIEGSKYIVEEFRLAEVSGVPQQIMVRYDALTDMIEVQNEKKELFSLVKQAPFTTITILPYHKMKLLHYKAKEAEINGYLVELYDSNDIALYRRDRIVLQKGKEAVNSYVTATPARYDRMNSEYYWSLKNATAIPIPKNKKEFQELYPTKKEEITTYFKNNSYSLKDEKSIIEMIKFISNL